MTDDPNIKALRAAGHDAAADLLERVAADRARQQAAPVKPAPAAAINLLDADPAEAQRRREGALLLGELRRGGIGAGWVTAGELIEGGDR